MALLAQETTYKYLEISFPAGFVSNGEFNYLRSKGYTRSLSVLQIRSELQNKYNRYNENTTWNTITKRLGSISVCVCAYACACACACECVCVCVCV